MDTRYVDEAGEARGLVEADYLFNFVPNVAMANVLPGPNGHHFVHFSVEIAPQDMTLASGRVVARTRRFEARPDKDQPFTIGTEELIDLATLDVAERGQDTQAIGQAPQ